MPSRQAVEDAMLALLRAALPASVPVDSLPSGDPEDAVRGIGDSGVWLLYVGANAGEPKSMGMLHSQAEAWSWAVVVLARNYRNQADAGRDALALLETSVDALVGVQPLDGLLKISKVSDEVMDLPDSISRYIGYQAIIAVQTHIRR